MSELRAELDGTEVIICYRIIEQVVKDTNQSRFLSQAFWKWEQSGFKGYYHFIGQALGHPDYRLEQSWKEKLMLSDHTWKKTAYGNEKFQGVATRITYEMAKEAGHSCQNLLH